MARKSCTDTRPCNLTTCYGCARKLIDDLAGHMLDQGMTQKRVDAFRYPAINALASQITPPAPKTTRARKASAPVEPELIKMALDTLRSCTSRAGAREYLKLLKVTELRAVAKAIKLGACSKLRKDELVEHLIHFTVQMKLNYDAILNEGRR